MSILPKLIWIQLRRLGPSKTPCYLFFRVLHNNTGFCELNDPQAKELSVLIKSPQAPSAVNLIPPLSSMRTGNHYRLHAAYYILNILVHRWGFDSNTCRNAPIRVALHSICSPSWLIWIFVVAPWMSKLSCFTFSRTLNHLLSYWLEKHG